MIKQIPNILTIFRFILILFIILSINAGNYILAITLFTISALSDIFDGFLARKLDAISNFGKLMDPLADKLTQLSILATLVYKHIIPSWILIIVLIKELLLIVGAAFLYGKDVVVFSRWYGKLATIMLYFSIVYSMIIKQLNLSSIYISIEKICYILTITMTCISLLLYVYDLRKLGIIDKSDITKDVNNVKLNKE